MVKKVVLSEADKYDKISPREHVLLRPDTYVGDIEPTKEVVWVFNDKSCKIEKREIAFTPGFFKCFDEILVNARDHSIRDSSCDTIKVYYNSTEGYIAVFNNGDKGIPVEEHSVHKMLVPTMIFSELLTSSNYDDTEQREVGGRNGYGAKLANIFSNRFIVEVGDARNKKLFVQEWTKNMSETQGPTVSTLPKGVKSYCKITFYPDFARFGIKALDDDHSSLFYRRAVDMAGVSDGKLKVSFNDTEITIKSFKDYVDLYYSGEEIVFDNSNKKWSVGCMYRPDSASEVISFVNGISTYRGGSHVDYVTDKVVKKLINDFIKKKDKNLKVTPQQVRMNLVFFINAVVVNPAFSSQTKDTLTTKVEKFGSTYDPTDAFMKKVAKTGVVEQVIDLAKYKEESSLKKMDGKKQVKIRGIPKLEDANKAGTKDSFKCTLILTEGDSAKTFAMAGLNKIGRDYYGVFPLKGKVLNVREASKSDMMKNEEIVNIMQILGLKHRENYLEDDKFKTLRYGKILILTDQDVDGSHIKGLLINMLHYLWPSLLVRPNFVASLATPIVKAFKGKETLIFYNLSEYEIWKDSPQSKGFTTKYYKGLGTSKSEEAQEYFEDIDDKMIHYFWDSAVSTLQEVSEEQDIEPEDEKDDEEDTETASTSTTDSSIVNTKNDNEAILLAFEKSQSNQRKKWLMNYDRNMIIKNDQKKIQYQEFIHKELKHFSNYDCQRSIPSVIDGFKPSLRKILYGAFERGLTKEEIKVVQLAGFVSDKAAYHHGEASLMGAIIGMAQDFVGSNNINLLKPNGQFGARLRGGKDSASPRYIYTMLEELTTKIFRLEDNPILPKQFDDGVPIEPEYYVPIIPMILVNGTDGIGTGFSTKLPCYNPMDVIENVKRVIKKQEYKAMDPWWSGFKGKVMKISPNKYEITGIHEIQNSKLTVTELPVGVWTSNYKEKLESWLDDDSTKKGKKTGATKKPKEKFLLGYSDNNTDTRVHFELDLDAEWVAKTKDIDKKLGLVKSYTVSNMHLYGPEGRIKKYIDVYEVIDDFYKVRLDSYVKRREHQLRILEHQLELISAKVRFILMVVEEKLIINNKKKSQIEEELTKHGFPKLGRSVDDTVSYDYLLTMPIYNLTYEKLEELKKNHKQQETEYLIMKDKTPDEIWLEELDELEKAYIVWYRNKMDRMENLQTSKPKKKLTKKK